MCYCHSDQDSEKAVVCCALCLAREEVHDSGSQSRSGQENRLDLLMTGSFPAFECDFWCVRLVPPPLLSLQFGGEVLKMPSI